MTPQPDPLIAVWSERVRCDVPDTIAIVLKGSHVTGAPGRHSDIDFDVLTSGEPASAYPVWFDSSEAGRMRHISAAVTRLDAWLEEREPEPWAFGLPVREPTRLLWAETEELRARLDRPRRPHPPADPEIEDAIESLGKMRNALERGDTLGLRLAAQALGRDAPTILRPLNPDVWASSPRLALDAVLAFPVAPRGFAGDLLCCLGLTDTSSAGEDLFAAGSRLMRGVIALAARHADTIAPLIASDLAGYLRDGTLAHYLRQIAET